MRRGKPISVVVRAPSRGLVSRLPSESADLLPSRGDISIPSTALSLGSLQRAASRASNVRYDQGVTRNAPGYETVEIESSILTGLVASWNLNEISGDRLDASVNAHVLTIVLGTDPTLSDAPSISYEQGLFGNAALFTALTYRSGVTDMGHLVLGFANGTYS